jgi:hypothetical protein
MCVCLVDCTLWDHSLSLTPVPDRLTGLIAGTFQALVSAGSDG